MLDAAVIAVLVTGLTVLNALADDSPKAPEAKTEQCADCAAVTPEPTTIIVKTAAPAAPMAAPAEAAVPAATPPATPPPAVPQPVGAPESTQTRALPAPPQPAMGSMDGAAPASPTPAPAVMATAGSATAPGFHINVGLFAVPSNAHNATLKLSGAGLPVYTDIIKSKTKGKLSRVRVGPFETREQADAAAARIHALQLDAVVFKR